MPLRLSYLRLAKRVTIMVGPTPTSSNACTGIYLKGRIGDSINAVLAAAAYLLLRWLA